MRRLITAVVGCAAVAVAALAGAPAASAGGADAKVADAKVAATASWYSGTYAPGQAVNWHWNAPAGVVYDVGLSPQGASTAATCQFEVTRDWYTLLPSGGRQYWWTVKNVGTIACGAQVLLTGQASSSSLGPYALDPGGSVTKEWNLDLADPVYLAGAGPSGATPSSACSMEITRTWFGRTTSGGVHMFAVLKNVGTIACTSTILFTKRAQQNFLQNPVLTLGSTSNRTWNNVNPLTNAYWTALSPSSVVSCKVELTRKVYAQRVWTDGSGTKRELQMQVKNVGGPSCSSQVLFASVAA
jgi:hypothetical protein